jgi:predicted nucleic acid-binding protein
VSFQTVAELELWPLIRHWGTRSRRELQEHIDGLAVVEYSRDLARLWAAAMASARQGGREMESADAWIAATALLYRVPLVTHNPHDFASVPGLIVITEQGS